MTKYDNLLEEVGKKATAFQAVAKKYIPRMYEALRNEDPHISPQDARDRIEKDCIGFWRKRTILEVLPAEAKNPEKQKAGRLSQKKRNFAAVSAAPAVEEIILDTDGRSSNIGAYPISDSINQHHDQSNQNGIGIDDNDETQTTATNQGKLVDYTKPKANTETSTIDDFTPNDTVQKLLSHPSDKEQCSQCVFTIPRERYGMVRDAMDKSKASIFVKFDENKKFLGADPDVVFDIPGSNHRDRNVQRIQSDDVAKDEEQKAENLAQIGYSNHALS